jgi:hypothetical protein
MNPYIVRGTDIARFLWLKIINLIYGDIADEGL